MSGRWNKPELFTALAFIAMGLGALWISRSYPMGTIIRMGPGFVPISLGILLAVVGGILALQSRWVATNTIDVAVKPFVFIMGGILLWALFVDRIGFVAATALLVVCCASVERESTWLSTALLAAGLCLGGYLIFIRGLGIPLSPF